MSQQIERFQGVRGEFTPVGRERELNSFGSAISRIKNLGKVSNTIYECHGTPGIGKTTLLRLMEKKCQELGVQHTKIDFNPKKSNQPDRYLDLTNIIEDLLVSLPDGDKEEVIKKIRIYRTKKGGDDQANQLLFNNIGRSFNQYMEGLSEKGPIVMLFDSAEQKDKFAGEWLEEWILNPLSQNGKILIVWASRIPERWKRFELRRKVIREGELPGLDKEAVNEQFKSQIQTKEKGAKTLYQSMQTIVFGHPLANQIIIDTINQWNKEKRPINAESLQANKQELIRVLKEVFIDSYVFERIENGAVRHSLEMMSLVRQFDTPFLSEMLSSDDMSKDLKGKNFGSLLSLLRGSQLVVWDNQRKGYAVDGNIKEILRLWLIQNDPQKFATLQEKAVKFYDKYIEKAGQNKYVYITEKLYHLANLKQVGGEVNLAEVLKQELNDIDFSKFETDLSIKQLDNLLHLFETDIELQGLLEKSEFKQLKRLITEKRKHPNKDLST